jgi:hypothetical protein
MVTNPHLFLWRLDAMQAAKQRSASGEPAVKPAIDRLQHDVAQSLTFQPVSVMDKEVIPPSGDKHDFMSQSPYWWPDPDSPNRLPYIRRDGEINPEVEQFDADRMRATCSAIETLSLGWYFLDDDGAARHAVTLLRAWFIDHATRMNPHLEYGQAVPGRSEGRSVGIIGTTAYCRLIDAIGLLEDSGAMADMDRTDLLMWMKSYRDWLLHSELGRGEANAKNNHGTWYDAQVSAIALYTGDPRITSTIAEEAKRDRIACQIHPDGSQPHELARTRSNHYAIYNLRAYLTLARLIDHTDADLWHFETDDGRSIRKAVDWLVPYALGQKSWTWQQITPFSRSEYVRIFRPALAAYRDATYQNVLDVLNADGCAAHREHLLW